VVEEHPARDSAAALGERVADRVLVDAQLPALRGSGPRSLVTVYEDPGGTDEDAAIATTEGDVRGTKCVTPLSGALAIRDEYAPLRLGRAVENLPNSSPRERRDRDQEKGRPRCFRKEEVKLIIRRFEAKRWGYLG
jgi:hypothetical protein